MAEAIMGVRIASMLHLINHDHLLPIANCTSTVTMSSHRSLELKKSICFSKNQRSGSQRREKWRIQAFPDWPLLTVLVQHVEGERDVILHKAVWHLNDEAIKSVCMDNRMHIEAGYSFNTVAHAHDSHEGGGFLASVVIRSFTLSLTPERMDADTMYIMFTCWGCCFFGSTKDPFYDSEQYRKEGGDGTGFWVYEKQEDIEEAARAQLWREELIEEIEQKVEGLRGLEEASKKNQEELVN